MGRYGLDSSDLGQRPVAGSCEHCIETPVYIIDGNFLD
jgi:hypothetical protein